MFGKEEKLTPTQIEKINSLIPEKFRKDSWSNKDFNSSAGIYQQIRLFRDMINNDLQSKKIEFEYLTNKGKDDVEQKIQELKISKIIVFNTELFEARPIGMVDVGMVKRFNSTSTGNRFENGMIGYAIEQASDEVWAKNNAQENALNEVKTELIKKAAALYPECNMIFKYESDFREMGSSGNVFIYLKGTAAIGNNNRMNSFKKEVKTLLDEFEQKKVELKKEIEIIQKDCQLIKDNIEKIPQSKFKSEIKRKLGE